MISPIFSLKEAARIVGATERNVLMWASQVLGEGSAKPRDPPVKTRRIYQVRLVTVRNLLQLAACSALRYVTTARRGQWASTIDDCSSYADIHAQSEGWQAGEASEIADQLARQESMLVLNIRQLESRVSKASRELLVRRNEAKPGRLNRDEIPKTEL